MLIIDYFYTATLKYNDYSTHSAAIVEMNDYFLLPILVYTVLSITAHPAL